MIYQQSTLKWERRKITSMYINEKYEILEILGKGGNGIVYKVQESDGRILAIKEVLLEPDENVRSKKKESDILRKCFHPGIPVVVDTFKEENRYYIVMEYVEGITLREYMIKQGKLSYDKALEIAIGIGDILNYLHSRSQPIYYGDLKPGNVMVTEDGQIRLIDFGSAVEEGSKSEGCYASAAYASPEQLKGKGADVRSDIYALGAIIHYMLTGEDPQMPPYNRRNLRECDIALPQSICKLVTKSLNDKPERRYQTVKGMMDEMRRFSGKEKQRKFWIQLGKGIGVFFFIGFAAFAYQAFEYWQWGVDFESNGPLITAMFFLVLFALWRGLVLSNTGGSTRYRVEKNIWKTDKKGIGLLIILFLVGIWGMEIGVQAKEIRDALPVIVYDEAGHKVLWQENKVNKLFGCFRAELPKECFEPGKEYNIIITLEDKFTQKILVKQFGVKTVKSSIEN